MRHKQIHFGTSGWRGLLAYDFTFDRVRAAVHAIADYVRQKNPRTPRLLVGYDTRFFSDEFARETAEILSQHQVRSFLCQQPTPTPTIAYEILRRQTDGGINFTASHNPPEYNGLKFSTPDGAPALPEVTRQLEKLAAWYLEKPPALSKPGKTATREEIDPQPAYLDRLAEIISVDEIQRAGLKVAFDPLYGTG
ncbi:MAG: phosphoglucomutase/phosphomannomutase family protein, partial [Terriglobia bacterium]